MHRLFGALYDARFRYERTVQHAGEQYLNMLTYIYRKHDTVQAACLKLSSIRHWKLELDSWKWLATTMVANNINHLTLMCRR